jgi:hypothetical protein
MVPAGDDRPPITRRRSKVITTCLRRHRPSGPSSKRSSPTRKVICCGGRVRHWSSMTPRPRPGFRKEVQRLGLGQGPLTELLSGERDVFTAACVDQLAGLHGPKGKPCPARPWVCLLCPLALFAPRHLPNLLRLKAYFARQFRAMPREHFAATFAPYARRLSSQILPRFPDGAIAAAQDLVVDRDEELPLRAAVTSERPSRSVFAGADIAAACLAGGLSAAAVRGRGVVLHRVGRCPGPDVLGGEDLAVRPHSPAGLAGGCEGGRAGLACSRRLTGAGPAPGPPRPAASPPHPGTDLPPHLLAELAARAACPLSCRRHPGPLRRLPARLRGGPRPVGPGGPAQVRQHAADGRVGHAGDRRLRRAAVRRPPSHRVQALGRDVAQGDHRGALPAASRDQDLAAERRCPRSAVDGLLAHDR